MAKSQIARGMYFGGEFFTELRKELEVAGWAEEKIFEVTEEKFKTGSGLAKEVAKLIVAAKNGAKNILHVIANLAFQDRIARGKYDWVNPDITEEHFPTVIPADYEAEQKLFHFNRSISSEAAIAEMGKEGFRPGTLAELLVLGETQPELQKQFPIIALGSLWRHSDGYRYVPALRWDGGGRELDLYWFGADWDDHYRFLAVRK